MQNSHFNPQIVAHNFAKKSDNYNKFADLQKESAQKLCDFAEIFLPSNPNNLVDLGSGTSFVAKNLCQKYPLAQIFEVDLAPDMLACWLDRPKNVKAIQADISALPFENNFFDAAFSSFALQWLENLEPALANLKQKLKKDAIVAFCIPTQNSLNEIVQASEKSGCNFVFNQLPAKNSLSLILQNLQFEQQFCHFEIINKKYNNAVDCLKEIKKIGANYFEKSLQKNWISKEKLQKFNDYFQAQRNNSTTWHLEYLIYKNNHV